MTPDVKQLLEKATPRPWECSGITTEVGQWWSLTAGPDDLHPQGSFRQADAALIVEAVNSYEALSSVVRQLVKWGTDPDLPEGEDWRQDITAEGFDVLRSIVDEARAALKELRGAPDD